MSVYQEIDVLTGLTMLKGLVQKQPEVLKQDFGICYHLNKMCSGGKLSYEYGFVNHFSKGWEHHSGIDRYPVNDNIKLGKWEGENLQLRLDLLEYLIKRVVNSDKNIYSDLKLRG